VNFYANSKRFVLASILALGCRALADAQTNAIIAPAVQPVTARDFYNAGTELLAAKKYPEAQQMFLSALAAQNDRVQPPALYNLGQTRFDDGLAALKKGPSAQSIEAQGTEVDSQAGSAIEHGQAALADNDLSKLIAAYIEGHGARRNLNEVAAAVRQAIQTYGETLQKWQQADDNFKSAAELDPSDADAARNAKIVEQYIARLVDSLRQMQQLAAKLGDKHQKLNEILKQIGGRIPKPNLPPGAPGDKDQDDGLQDSLRGMEEGPTRIGNELEERLSREQAGQILNGIPLDAAKRLSTTEAKNPRNANPSRTW
jgi:hypothetical protein